MKRRYVSRRGVRLVARFEGYRRWPYLDAVGVPTIGFGETRPDIIHEYRQTGISRRRARKLLRERLNKDYAPFVRALGVPLNQNRFDALCSFVYNLGGGAIGSDTGVGRALRARQWRRAADEMLKWNRAGGRVLPGLVRRRRAERRLFLRPTLRR